LESRSDLSWPADIYFEGSDQHRGWFHTSLLQACGTKGKPPYKKVLTHGFVLDEKGHKMSKSLGNTVSPNDIINTMGADMLRLWVASADYTDDVRIGKEIIKHTEDIYRRLRNTLRYLLGALNSFDENLSVDYEEMPDLEKWVLHRLKELEVEHSKIFKTYDFAAFYNEIHNFCTNDLSAFYFDIRKDRLYCDAEKSTERLATLSVMHLVFKQLIKWLAPVLSFTAEEAWHAFKKIDTATTNEPLSIHLETFEEMPRQWGNPSLAARIEELRQIRKLLTGALELERASKTIGSSLQAKVIIYINSEWSNRLDNVDWAEFAIASQTVIVHAQVPTNAFTIDEVKGVGAVVEMAEGNKCSRCWKILPEVGSQSNNDLCKRCDTVINECESSCV
jgi:isoleucyl-tRNA synthetase